MGFREGVELVLVSDVEELLMVLFVFCEFDDLVYVSWEDEEDDVMLFRGLRTLVGEDGKLLEFWCDDLLSSMVVDCCLCIDGLFVLDIGREMSNFWFDTF